jgi:hypothetical protein
MTSFGCRSREPDLITERGSAGPVDSSAVHLRVNLLGYLEDDGKVAVAFSHRTVEAGFDLVDGATEQVVFTGTRV